MGSGQLRDEEFVALSVREAQLVKLLAAGENEEEIAARLHVSPDALRSDLEALSGHLREATQQLAPAFEQPVTERAS